MAKDSCDGALFEGLFQKTVVSRFDSELRTSDGGASLLAAVDRKTRLTKTLCGLLQDERDPARVEHPYLDLFRQRVFSIGLGYPDGNNSAQIGRDPMMKLVCGRGPGDEGERFQPTRGDRERVKKLVGFGLRQEEIAQVVKNGKTGNPIAIRLK